MSKKKNTLKDLDEFLKQQAATIVPPTPLSEKVEKQKPTSEQEKPVIEPKEVVAEITEAAAASVAKQPTQELSLEKILEDLETLAQKEGTSFRKKVYDLVLQAADSEEGVSQAEDKVLINTILYLKNGSRWKDAIRDYWRAKG
ncbi:hypothetical protein [Pseudochryseolinea flava]|uniref:Uncharacterized protein n=1 Tax=Pseudochryseolinea flava TaxID=2059302 RepID=A0A364XVA4_9BACT|nr:hypothetical protein [Pseudochryseolinea flava]RAV98277.1 hypothetical protein DQQ10_24315 [Pseudochryseolinea flava]